MENLKKFIDIVAESVLREGISHIEDLKPQDLLDFLSNWNLDKKTFHVSEKVDGNFFGFGLDNGQFYVRSKNKRWTSAEEISNLFFMQSFKDYFKLLEKVPLASVVSQLAGKYKFSFDGSIDISGEAIPSYDHNIVIYDEKKIGDGIFVIFDTVIGGESFNNPNFWIDLAAEMNKYTTVKVYAVPEVDLSKLEFDNELVVSLEDIINKHGNFLKKPARTPEEKELKQKLLAAVKEIGMTAKQQVLQTKFKSLFGDEYEGIVLASPDGKLVKVVEKDKFKARKERNWHFIDQLISAQRDFKKAIKNDPKSLKRELVKWERSLDLIKKDYAKNKDKHIDIPKKGEDTEKSIELDDQVIQIMKDMLNSMSPEEVVAKYFNKEVVPENTQASFSSGLPMLKEGGGAFEQVNSVVPRELLQANIRHALEQAGFGKLKYEIVGNSNKPFLGDIDIAVDKNEIINRYGLSSENFWEDLKNLLKADSSKIIKGLKQFHLLSDLIDNSGNQIKAFSETGERIEEPGLIQIDVFVGNLGWMKSVVSGAPADSKYKAVYRNLFLNASFAIIRWPSKANPNVYNKLETDTKEGFKLVQKQKSDKKDKKISEKIFSVDPDTVTHILFNKTIQWNDIASFEKLWALFNSNQFRFKKYRADIVQEFKKTLIKNKKDIPSELE